MHRLKKPLSCLSLVIGLSAAMAPAAHSTWIGDGRALSPAATNFKPTIASDGQGGSIIAWYGGNGSDIFAQRVMSNGTTPQGWPTSGPLVVCAEAGLQQVPVMVSDLAGGVLIFWQDSRNGSTFDIYAQHVSAGGGVFGEGSSNWIPGGIPISTALGNQFVPAAVSDGAGGAIVVWQDGRDGAGNYNLWAQHVDGDGSPMWGPGGRAVCLAANNQINPTVIPDGSGGAFIAWQDYRKGTEFDIYMQHINASGVMVSGGQWVENGLGICTATNSQFNPTLAPDGTGGAFITWQDFRSPPDNHIFAQRLTGSGAIPSNWPANGTPVCQAQYSQYNPVVASDGSGGAFIAWQDYRSGTTNQVYAQHLTAGNVELARDGFAISQATQGQFLPQIASDGQNGAFVTWYDSRSGSTNDIYVQRLDNAGRKYAGWDPNGLAVCLATNTQQFPVVATSSPGSAILTWQDLRSGGETTAAIFAGPAIATPTLSTEESDPVNAALAAPQPNPSRGATRVQMALPHSAHVQAEVLDLSGRRVATIASGTFAAGTHALTWDGRMAGGARAAPGIYLVRVAWAGFEKTQRIVRVQ